MNECHLKLAFATPLLVPLIAFLTVVNTGVETYDCSSPEINISQPACDIHNKNAAYANSVLWFRGVVIGAAAMIAVELVGIFVCIIAGGGSG